MKQERTQNAPLVTRAILPFALISTFLWGCAYPALKGGYAAFAVDPGDTPSLFLFAGTRFFLAGIATLLLALAVNRRLPRPTKAMVPAIASLALLQTFGQYAFYYIGLANTTGVRASILNATASFLSVILSGLIWRKRDAISPKKLMGCALGLGGVALVNLGASLGDAPITLRGEGFVLMASVMIAFGSIASKVTTQGLDPMEITGWQLTLGGGALWLVGQATGGHLGTPDASGIALMAFMVFISSAAFTLWTMMLKYHPVSKVAVYNFLTPVFGALLSGLFLSESLLSPVTLCALALVVSGIVLVNRE